jgi:hypothetical protein
MLVTKYLPGGRVTLFVVGLCLLLAASFVIMWHPSRTVSNLTLVLVLLIVFGPMMLPAFLRIRAKTVAQTEQRIALVSPLSADAAFAKLKGAKLGRIKLIDGDAERRVLVFESPMTGWSWGFFHPVFIRPAAQGSEIEVGIRHKTIIQCQSTVRQWHDTCAAEIKKALEA